MSLVPVHHATTAVQLCGRVREQAHICRHNVIQCDMYVQHMANYAKVVILLLTTYSVRSNPKDQSLKVFVVTCNYIM